MKRIRFSIATLLVLIAVAACLMAYLSHCRQKGRDSLIKSLLKANAELKYIDQADDATQELLAEYNAPLTRMDFFLGTSQKPVFEIHFNSDSKLNRETARQISIGNSANAITTLRFRNAKIGNESAMFFCDWKELRHIEIRDTHFPENWLEQFAELPKLESLVISGGMCNLNPKHLGKLELLQSLTLADRGIGSMELKRIRKLMPNTEVQLVAGYDSPHAWETGRPYSAHDPEAFSQMKSTFDRLHKILDNMEPPATNKFNPPATEVDIAAIEFEMGMPLHPSVRALLEIHSGQPGWQDELVSFEKLLSANEMTRKYVLLQKYSEKEGYDFTPLFMRNSNPNLIPIGSSDDNELAVNVVDGSVWEFYSESFSPTWQLGSLIEYMEMVISELEAGRFEDGHEGKIKVKGFGPKQWNSKKGDGLWRF